nr:MAG TPA: hypothetical protein [Caudoviricetes sp.]
MSNRAKIPITFLYTRVLRRSYRKNTSITHLSHLDERILNKKRHPIEKKITLSPSQREGVLLFYFQQRVPQISISNLY